MKRQKRKFDIGTLVDLVVYTMRSDTTSPDPKNPRAGWQTDQLLIGHIDKLMTYQLNDPAGYAEIGRRVAVQVSDLPKMVALAKIAELRGKRLIMPVSAKRKQSLLALIRAIAELVASLPLDPCQKRLASLLDYNKGVAYDAWEMFTEAAEMQAESAKIAQANGDKSGEAVGYFLRAVYQLKDALCQPSTDEAKAVFSIMEERYAKLVEAVRGTPLEVSWGQGNAPCHMLQACIWLGQDRPDMGKWVASVVSAAGSLKGVWGDIAKHYSAMNSFRLLGKEESQAMAELEKTAAGSGDVTRRAEALLALARSAIFDDEKGVARNLVKRMPKKGASHIRAIAERLLQEGA